MKFDTPDNLEFLRFITWHYSQTWWEIWKCYNNWCLIGVSNFLLKKIYLTSALWI